MPFDPAWNSTTDFFNQIPHSCHFVLHIAVNTNVSEGFVFTAIWSTDMEGRPTDCFVLHIAVKPIIRLLMHLHSCLRVVTWYLSKIRRWFSFLRYSKNLQFQHFQQSQTKMYLSYQNVNIYVNLAIYMAIRYCKWVWQEFILYSFLQRNKFCYNHAT